MKSRIIMVAAMLGLLATACNKEEVTTQDDMTVKTPVTISATYGGNGSKVNYTESGNTISATWQSGDKLLVIYNNHVNTLDLTTGAGSTSATFTGTISGTPAEGATLVCYVKDQNSPSGTVTVNGDGSYIYTSDAFLGQDGTLASAAKLNLYGGWTRYSSTSDINCSFSVNTSMMKFKVHAPAGISEGTTGATLTYKSGSTELAKATFTVGTGGENTIYLTIPAGHYTGEQALVYHSGDITKTETLSSTQANFVAGQTYSKELNFNPLAEPLTFEAITAGTQISFSLINVLSGVVQYNKYDGNGWQNYTSNTNITLTNVGDKVSFRGNNASYSESSSTSSKFSSTTDCYLYGNVMSLVNPTNYASLTSVSAYAFTNLFSSGSHFKNHPSKDILLPATTLGRSCYQCMFIGSGITRAPKLPATNLAVSCYEAMFSSCNGLTQAPELPATTLADWCYAYMFQVCPNLNSAPNLPATTLKNNCYSYMFARCTSLTIAPELPATTLASNCYSYMFYRCSGLTTAPALPATTLADSCYYHMFRECASLTTAPTLPATTLTESCYREMFRDCTNLTTVPELPARTLTNCCYHYMFYNCTNLNYVKCLATSNISSSNTLCWLDNVSPSGTFIKASGASWPTGYYGIPSGWTVIEE